MYTFEEVYELFNNKDFQPDRFGFWPSIYNPILQVSTGRQYGFVLDENGKALIRVEPEMFRVKIHKVDLISQLTTDLICDIISSCEINRAAAIIGEKAAAILINAITLFKDGSDNKLYEFFSPDEIAMIHRKMVQGVMPESKEIVPEE